MERDEYNKYYIEFHKKRMKNRNEKKRRLKENVSLEDKKVSEIKGRRSVSHSLSSVIMYHPRQ